jgi:predicted NBD/HSP70 family sugar kinase
VFDLRLVVLAGSVPASFGPALLDAARRELDQRSRMAHVRGGTDRSEHRVRLEVTSLGREAPLVGAAALARWSSIGV